MVEYFEKVPLFLKNDNSLADSFYHELCFEKYFLQKDNGTPQCQRNQSFLSLVPHVLMGL